MLTTGHSASILPIGEDLAHNIVAHGRWFVGNVRAEDLLGTLTERSGRLVDPASVNLSYVDQHGQWYAEVDHPVGASVVTAGLWAITGSERFLQVEIFQSVLDALVALLVYWIAMQLFRRPRAALAAALAYALYPPLAFVAINPYDDIWAVDITIALVALCILAMKSGYRWRWLIVTGLVAGAGAYFRPQVLLIAPVFAIATIGRTGWREALRRGLTPLLVSSLLLVPWTVRNYEDFHAFVPIRAGFWETMESGLSELPTHLVNEAENAIVRAHPGIVAESPAWHADLKHYFLQAVEQHPVFYLEVLAHRVLLATVLANETRWMHGGTGAVLGYSGGLLAFVVERPLELLEFALPNVVFLLAMLGLGLTWRRWREGNAILVAVVLSVLVPYLAMHVEERYLLPAFFAYFIWIGLGAELAIGRIRRRSGRHAHTAGSVPNSRATSATAGLA
ncbi:MAG TPA: glycosyltransferase family 39 protein [Solirubrobacteraceae bacterium]|nr:glycosyltransferase family 39 protein [Solirubrobacteraceae bacterium]